MEQTKEKQIFEQMLCVCGRIPDQTFGLCFADRKRADRPDGGTSASEEEEARRTFSCIAVFFLLDFLPPEEYNTWWLD